MGLDHLAYSWVLQDSNNCDLLEISKCIIGRIKPRLHFWSGYYCLINREGAAEIQPQVAISDIIKIVSDLGNKIPDKSWMLYLLELFNKQNIPVELNLICSFNDDGKFYAIFAGVNRYEFKLKPVIGHSYLRQIILEPPKHRIGYRLIDEISGQADTFFFDVDADSFDFSISEYFTGLEWHNRMESVPYPIRYEVEISHLAYGILDDLADLQSVAYFPYDQLLPNDDGGLTREYPVSFHDFQTRNGFITYKIVSAKHQMGLMKKFFNPYM